MHIFYIFILYFLKAKIGKKNWWLQLLLSCSHMNALLHGQNYEEGCPSTSWISSKSSLLPLSHHEVSCPSGEEQSTKKHRVAEENKLEDFPECPQEADEQGLQLHWFLLLFLPSTGNVNQLFHVPALTHSARTQTEKRHRMKIDQPPFKVGNIVLFT